LKVWLKRVLFFFVLLIVFTIVGIFMALQSSPHLQPIHQIDANSAAENKRIVQRLIQSFKSKEQTINLQVTQTELYGLSAFGHRAIPQLTSDVTLFKDNALVNFSLELPFPEIIKYLNVEVMLVSSQQGLDFDTAYIGDIALPGNAIIKLAEWLTNSYVKEEFGTSLLQLVKSIDITAKQISVNITLPEDFDNKNLSKKDGLFALRDQLALFGDVEDIRFYHQSLVDYIEQSSVVGLSLAEYLGFTFGLVKQRKLAGIIQSLTEENRAALTALVIYFGTDKFELLVGDIANLSSQQKQKRNMLRASVKLRNRVDIQKHFIYSAALQLFGSSSTSNAIGELKEFLDSNSGGSGFSFADLMADRAGTRLAMLATDNDESALVVLKNLADITDEALVLPALVGLPEGITQQSFEKYYRDINSLVYTSMIQKIDERLREIPVYGN